MSKCIKSQINHLNTVERFVTLVNCFKKSIESDFCPDFMKIPVF